MVRDRNVYRCQQCGFASPKPGTCPDCKRMTGDLMALVEERAAPEPGGRRIGLSSSRPRALSDITMEHTDRLRTGIGELDRVLGGGVVPGSLVLIGGDPGIGKSTLLIQAARALATAAPPVLYVSAEESAAQVKLRAERLGISSDGLLLWTETDLVTVEAELDTVKPKVLIIDSIQTVFLPTLESAPGSVAKVRECGGRLMTIAKGRGIATFLVGHVTKEGALAGPRVLEHLVDTVLYFEGEQHHAYRVLRAVKNRFGSTNEIGVFQMAERGLLEVKNPSGFFLAERPKDVPGLVIVAGGGRVMEPAADLAVLVAAASSYMDRPVRGDVVVLGEVGLTGEVRAVTGLEARLREAAQLGFTQAVVPRSNLLETPRPPLEAHGVATVHE